MSKRTYLVATAAFSFVMPAFAVDASDILWLSDVAPAQAHQGTRTQTQPA